MFSVLLPLAVIPMVWGQPADCDCNKLDCIITGEYDLTKLYKIIRSFRSALNRLDDMENTADSDDVIK